MRLEGKRAIVTGAGRGIGKAIAAKLLREGSAVLICDLVEERTSSALEDLRRFGKVEGLTGDVTDSVFGEKVVRDASERLGGLDILINNAGTSQAAPFLEHTEEQ